jgi:hypothetical protein
MLQCHSHRKVGDVGPRIICRIESESSTLGSGIQLFVCALHPTIEDLNGAILKLWLVDAQCDRGARERHSCRDRSSMHN